MTLARRGGGIEVERAGVGAGGEEVSRGVGREVGEVDAGGGEGGGPLVGAGGVELEEEVGFGGEGGGGGVVGVEVDAGVGEAGDEDVAVGVDGEGGEVGGEGAVAELREVPALTVAGEAGDEAAVGEAGAGEFACDHELAQVGDGGVDDGIVLDGGQDVDEAGLAGRGELDGEHVGATAASGDVIEGVRVGVEVGRAAELAGEQGAAPRVDGDAAGNGAAAAAAELVHPIEGAVGGVAGDEGQAGRGGELRDPAGGEVEVGGVGERAGDVHVARGVGGDADHVDVAVADELAGVFGGEREERAGLERVDGGECRTSGTGRGHGPPFQIRPRSRGVDGDTRRVLDRASGGAALRAF
jgi:hypothetical protein